MILPITILLGAVGYLYYNSKDEVTFIEVAQLDSSKEKIEDDDLYKDLEDLFIWFIITKIYFLLFAKTHVLRMQA